ncbi:MAG: hypothetical protein AB9866_18900 [Syntrophobacteraceae bacterium]
MAEHELQNLIIQFLRYDRYGFYWRNNTGTARKGKCYVKFGLKGSADIIGLHQGRFVAIECKDKGKGIEEDQIKFQQEVERAGGIYYLANDFDKFEQWYRDLTTKQ